ncbi:MAG: sugar-transfer associated ATP-grasp domain-containing protein [Thiogranum sp.]
MTRLRAACSASGQSVLPQLVDMIRLRAGPTRLGAHEYIDLRLYDNDKYSFAQKREFGGTRFKFAVLDSLNSPEWMATGNDKLVNYALLRALGLPYPEIHAIAAQRPRYFGDTPCFSAKAPLADFIRTEMSYPFFAKPARGYYGIGACAVSAYHAADDALELYDGSRLPVTEFTDQLLEHAGEGYLFQECLHSHPDVAAVCGNTVTTCRLDIFLDGDGPRLFYNTWKIPTGNNMIDNFHDGLTGNLLGLLDNDSGTVKRVVDGIGPDQDEVMQHPDTHQRLPGFRIPEWDRIKALCFKAATAFPGLRFQGWDVAVTPRGPVLVELNASSDLHGRQYASGRGVYNARLKDYLSRNARRKKR